VTRDILVNPCDFGSAKLRRHHSPDEPRFWCAGERWV